MLQTVNYLNSYSKRFDFGVPLEDVFPPNDVHPRLRYLFEEAVQVYLETRLNIEKILRQLQGSLETRLKLKEKLVNDINYNISSEDIDNSPGAYFWVIRHFLGLLPIPLLPEYANEIKFNWIYLSEKCRCFLEHYKSERGKKCQLDYNIAENLNLLPFAHFLLLNVMVTFIRKLSQKPFGPKINRKVLLCLAKYYCTSISIRPYRPGYHNGKDEKIFPLFCYLLVRWREIEKHCRSIGHPAYFLESNCLNYETCSGISIRDNWAQTQIQFPEVITICKNVPYFCNNNNYLLDACSQTEQIGLIERGIQSSEIAEMEIRTSQKALERKDEFLNNIDIDNNPVVLENEKSLMESDYKNAEFSFRSTEATSNQAEWTDIVKETMKTVKKVEEYIYDDYETFSKEDYNQISVNKSKISMFEKMSKIGWTYMPPKITEVEVNENKTEGSQNSYFKFDDVFDDDGNCKASSAENNAKCVLPINDDDDRLNVTFKKCNYSTPLCSASLMKSDKKGEDVERKKKNFNFKKFKIKLDFLRVLAPKKVNYHSPSYDSLESKVKYKKMRNVKSSTL